MVMLRRELLEDYKCRLLCMSSEEYERVKAIAIRRRDWFGEPGLGEVVCPLMKEVVVVDEHCKVCELRSSCFVHK